MKNMCADTRFTPHVFRTVAELKAEAARIETNVELDCQTRAREAEIQFLKEQNELETTKARELGTIEVSVSE